MTPENDGLDKSSPYNIIIHVGVAFMTPENNGLDKSSPYIR